MAETPPVFARKKRPVNRLPRSSSWKVAYADFVTAMMAFFMVMWIIGLSDSDKASIQGYFNDPLGFAKNEPRNRVNLASFKSSPARRGPWIRPTGSAGALLVARDQDSASELGEKIESAVRANLNLRAISDHVDVTVSGDGIRLEFIEGDKAVFFDSGSAKVRPEARHVVAEVARLIVESGRAITIEGHTDARPYGSARSYDNWDLSNDRAQAIRRLLMENGVPSERFVEVSGFADTRLRRPDAPFDGTNRRVSVLLAAASGRSPDKPKVVPPPVDIAPSTILTPL